MTEPLGEMLPPETMYEAIEPDAALSRKNVRWAWTLVGVFLLLFGGTFGVAFVYLWFK
jgi:hypothetical protein